MRIRYTHYVQSVSKLSLSLEKHIPPTTTDPGDVEVYEDEDIKLTVEVTGKPEPDVVWYQGTKKLSSGPNMTILTLGSKHTLEMRHVQLTDTGIIKVVVSNDAGNCDTKSKITIKGILFILLCYLLNFH